MNITLSGVVTFFFVGSILMLGAYVASLREDPNPNFSRGDKVRWSINRETGFILDSTCQKYSGNNCTYKVIFPQRTLGNIHQSELSEFSVAE